MNQDLKDEENIQNLVNLIKNGNKDAFSDLYDIFVEPLYRYLYFSVAKSDIDDMTMTIFIKVWEKIASYKDQKKASFKSWFFKLARNSVVDYYRSSKETLELFDFIEDEKEDANPASRINRRLTEEALKLCLNKLKANYREFLTLKFLGELTNKEISQIMGKNEDSLRVLQHRSLNALKVIVKEERIV